MLLFFTDDVELPECTITVAAFCVYLCCHGNHSSYVKCSNPDATARKGECLHYRWFV